MFALEVTVKIRRSIALASTGALILGLGIVSWPAGAAQPLSVSLPAKSAPANAPAVRSAPAALSPTVATVPVRVTLGGGVPAKKVTVSLVSSDGKVKAKANTNTKGVAFFKPKDVPAKFTAKVTAGKEWNKLGKPALAGPGTFDGGLKVTFVSPVTSIAMAAAKTSGKSYATALNRTKTTFAIPTWASVSQMSMVSEVFDPTAFKSWSAKNGGMKSSIVKLSKAVNAGKKVPGMAPMKFENRLASRSAVTWVGQQLMGSIIKTGTSDAIGNMFGQPNPSASALSTIESDLQTISTQLTGIQQSMNQLLNMMAQSELTELQQTLAPMLDDTVNDWDSYQAAMALDPTDPDYNASLYGYASTFYGDFNGKMGEWNSLFTSTVATGVLAQMYNNATGKSTGQLVPWWNSSDVAGISNFIDYYGTQQAMATAMLDESYKYSGKNVSGLTYPYTQTASYVASQDTINAQVNSNIYLSIPTQIDGQTIVDTQTQMQVKSFKYMLGEVYAQRYESDATPTCSSQGSSTSQSYPALGPTAASSWPGVWQSALNTVTSGWTPSPVSTFNALKVARTVPGTGAPLYSLGTLQAGDGVSWAMVTSATTPIAAYAKDTFENNNTTYFRAWMFCDSNATTFNNQSDWVLNFNADNPTSPISVRIMAEIPGKFAYVQPPAS